MPAGKLDAALPHIGIIPVFERRNKIMGASPLCSLDYFIPGRILPAVGNVFINRPGKKVNILLHHTDILPQALYRIMVNILPVQADFTFVNIVEAGNQITKCSLAAAGRPHNGNLFSRADFQIQIPKNNVVIIGVFKADIVK